MGYISLLVFFWHALYCGMYILCSRIESATTMDKDLVCSCDDDPANYYYYYRYTLLEKRLVNVGMCAIKPAIPRKKAARVI